MTRRQAVMANFEKYADYTEDRISRGIEENRKGFAFINLRDKNGCPVENAEITAVQQNHEFKYGANIFMIDQMETPEKNEAYKEYFKDTFNMATLGFYWSDLEPERGKPRYEKGSPFIYRRPPIDDCIEFCEKHGIEPREHALAYDHFFPQWLKGKDNATVKAEFERRCREISERYADKIPTIEVTNEMYWGRADSVTDLYMTDEFIPFCFNTAEKYFPKNQLVINDFCGVAWCEDSPTVPSRGRYPLMIKDLLHRGVRIDSVGLQYHMFFRRDDEAKFTRWYYDPTYLYKVMDMYKDMGMNMQVTEVTVPAYSNDPADEELQADIIEKLYSIWFSHPNMEQIIYWNLVDGYAAFAPLGDMTAGENYYYGGLVRHDMTPKPALKRIQHLFKEKWITNTSFSVKDGFGSFKGFYGKYKLNIKVGDKEYEREIDLSKKSSVEFDITL